MDIRARIERHNATPELLTAGEYVEAVQSAGFEVIEAVDQQAEYGHPATPWYMALQGRDLSLSSLARIPAGRALTAGVTGVLERLRGEGARARKLRAQWPLMRIRRQTTRLAGPRFVLRLLGTAMLPRYSSRSSSETDSC